MLRKRNCTENSCGSASVSALDQQALCLNHFLLRCYEKLERLDPRGRSYLSEPMNVASMRAFIEECSRKTLDISLQCANLTNLQRGRLLDILLWASELFLLLRAPRITFTESADSAGSQLMLRAGAARNCSA
ncbi:MAG TPA: hypothetical protein VFN26_08885 [Candidatus Acidoferrum sp.]|nr:hypothetical protein [Candidatus Acidoferrum sp.]